MCPHRRAFVLDHGLIGDDPRTPGALHVSCPMHKRNFSLAGGECTNDDAYAILTFAVKREGDDLLVLLPDEEELDGVIGTSRWMVRQTVPEERERSEMGDDKAAEIAGAPRAREEETTACSGLCGDKRLEW